MNSRTRIVLIGVVLAAALFALWPTYQLYQINQERNALLQDSTKLARWDSLNGSHRRDVQHGNFLSRPINLGLDLRGGMYLTMEVDAPTLLLENAQPDAVDEPFQKVIDATRAESQNSDENIMDVFMKNFNAIARPQGKSLLNYYDLGLSGANATEEMITKQLSKNIDDAVDQAIEVVRRRIDQFGVSEVSITRQAGRRIVIELPGVSDEGNVRSLLQTTARLEFKGVRDSSSIPTLFRQIDQVLAGKIVDTATTSAKKDSSKAVAAKADSATAKKDSTKTKMPSAKDSALAAKDTSAKKKDTAKGKNVAADTSGKSDTSNPYASLPKDQQAKAYVKDHPFSSLFVSYYNPPETESGQPQMIDYVHDKFPRGSYTFMIARKDMDKVKALLHRPDVRAVWPEDMIIAYDAKPMHLAANSNDPGDDVFYMYVVTKDPELTGEVISNAQPDFDPQTGKPIVNMEMNQEGADRWAAITGRYIKKRVAIILDSAVYSAPTVQNKITGGRSQISGSTDAKEANLLAVVLKAGALKAPIKIIEDRVVGPSLGEDSIREGITATAAAALLVMIFMLFYYMGGGIIADIAVIFNVLITLAVLSALGATLTLPGIGGLVLTIGMAVDGNILIYERIREELAHGRNLQRAVQLGYEKAFAAIIDTHITTFMTGLILYMFGSGPIQGFAVTLMIGIAATLFTAVFCTRTVFLTLLDRGTRRFNFGQTQSAEVATAA